MPVLVVGADTPVGREVIETLVSPGREVRAFVTDERQGEELRGHGVKVAFGDVSDDGHIEAAATGCFSVVLVTEAIRDQRERSFGDDPADLMQRWATAASGAKRIIWVSAEEPPSVSTPEVVVVHPDAGDVAEQVSTLDEAASL